MPLGYTASFSTSHIRPYTGPKASAGVTAYGTGGTVGPRGPIGPTGLSGPSGPTGMRLVGTYLQTDKRKPAYNYYVLEFADVLGNYVTAAPRGLTGTHGPLWNGVNGATAFFYNTKDCDAPVLSDLQAPCGFTGVFSGVTYISPTFRPWGGHGGQSGATLSFRSIGVSGDLEIYKSGKIGPGITYDVLGISGPDAAVQYGTVTLQSENEIVYLADKKNVKDAYGLTFNPPGPTPEYISGLTWGTIDVNFYNYSEHFYIHGNAIDGVIKDPFIINLREGYGNVHQIFAPFSLSGISAEFHPSKSPIVSGPSWLSPTDWRDGISGVTAEFGEAISVTLIIDGGPFDISFSEDFYFSEDVKFTNGRDILNCLSYDHCNSWFCTSAGSGFNADVSNDVFGSCCENENHTCYDYILETDCDKLGIKYNWYAETTCKNTPCGTFQNDGSCCINKSTLLSTNSDEFIGPLCLYGPEINPSDCQRFGGKWRAGIPCGSKWPCCDSCGDPDVGACCRYSDDGTFVNCLDNICENDCVSVLDGYGIYQGDLSYCSGVNCEDDTQTGACCLSSTSPTHCVWPTTSSDCYEQGGSFKLNQSCEDIDCSICNESEFKELEEESFIKQRISTVGKLPKLSGVVCNGTNGMVVSDVYKHVVEKGISSVKIFIPNITTNSNHICSASNIQNMSTVSICLGNDKNLLGKECITLVVPPDSDKQVASAFGGVAYEGKYCKEVNCKERHGTDLIHTDMGKTLIGTNITSSGKCKLKDGTIINGCDENYCKSALGGTWKENNIKPNQQWNITSSGGQFRRD